MRRLQLVRREQGRLFRQHRANLRRVPVGAGVDPMPINQQRIRVLEIKIPSYKSPQRYAVRKTITAAHSELRKEYPDLEIHLTEIKDVPEILRYTQVLILPSLMVKGKLVCVGRFPKKNEVIGWFSSQSNSLRPMHSSQHGDICHRKIHDLYLDRQGF